MLSLGKKRLFLFKKDELSRLRADVFKDWVIRQGYASQFIRLDLVKAAAVGAAFVQEMLLTRTLEQLKQTIKKVGVLFDCPLYRP